MDVLEVVQAHLDAFNERDLEAVLAAFDDDAAFTSGDQTVVGLRSLRSLFTEAFSVPADATLHLRRAVVEGDTAACELTERVAVSGTVQELDVAAFYTVRRGRLVRVRVYREP